MKNVNEGTGETVNEVLNELANANGGEITDADITPDALINEVQRERVRLIRSKEKVFIAQLTLLTDTVHTSLALKKLAVDKENMNSTRELALDVIKELGKLAANPFTSSDPNVVGSIPDKQMEEIDDIVPGELEVGLTDLTYDE